MKDGEVMVKKHAEFKLPPIDLEPKLEFSYEYGETPFDPVAAGFNDFEFIGYLPCRKSLEIKESPIGIGYEVLDRDKYDFARTLPVMKNSGVKWARVQTGWNKTEKQKGVYDFQWLDEIVDGLLGIGIRPWFSVSYGNALYTVDENHEEGYCTNVSLHYGEEAVQGWKNYAAALARHYKGRVTHWEVWNEPNCGFWGRREDPSPAEYVELVKITAEQVKRHIPNAKIIGGALTGGSCCNQYINGLVKNNLADYIDVFSYHPYGLLPELYIENRLKYMKNAFAGCGKKIEFWQGECGRPSKTLVGGRGWKLTTANQARYLTRRILTDLRIGFDMTSYFLVCDLHRYLIGGGSHNQGVIETENYTPKPAFFALQSMAYLFDAETKYVDGTCVEIHRPWEAKLSSVAEYLGITAAFRRGNIPIYAYYFPENIDIDYGFRRIVLCIWIDDNLKFKNPIMIDPVTRKVFKYIKDPELIARELKAQKGMYYFWDLPLLDYPLFITDLSLINAEGKTGI